MGAEAQRVYGEDPAGYDAGRPDYPPRIYDVLDERCGLAAESDVLEIGPGTGRVTGHLLDRGARVVAVEPDVAAARRLGDTFPTSRLQVIGATFEEAPVAVGGFDLAVAAMSFHWVDLVVGSPKLGRAIRPGGWVALWWTVLGDPDRPDPFRDATRHLLDDAVPGRRAVAPGGDHRDARGGHGRPPELDEVGWRAQLTEAAGLVDVEAEIMRWTVRLDAGQVRALYGSLIVVRRRPPEQRQRLLDALEAVAGREFGGAVDRPLVAALYTGRRP